MSGPFYECDRCKKKISIFFSRVSIRKGTIQESGSATLDPAGLGYDLCKDCEGLVVGIITNPITVADISATVIDTLKQEKENKDE